MISFTFNSSRISIISEINVFAEKNSSNLMKYEYPCFFVNFLIVIRTFGHNRKKEINKSHGKNS